MSRCSTFPAELESEESLRSCMENIRTCLFFSIALVVVENFAIGGFGTGNGGDAVALEFKALSRESVRWIDEHPPS